MKTTLWAAIMANGNYMHGGSGYRWKPQVFEDFDACALAAGNCILGRKTYEEYVASGGSFARIETVVVSRTHRELPGATFVASPDEALRYLEQKGHTNAFVAGGDSLLNAFLAANLANEIVFNLTPELGGVGNHVGLPGEAYRPMKLLEVRELGDGILKLRYSLDVD